MPDSTHPILLFRIEFARRIDAVEVAVKSMMELRCAVKKQLASKYVDDMIDEEPGRVLFYVGIWRRVAVATPINTPAIDMLAAELASDGCIDLGRRTTDAR